MLSVYSAHLRIGVEFKNVGWTKLKFCLYPNEEWLILNNKKYIFSLNIPKTTTSPPPALKVFHINFQSLREKKLQFFSFVELNKPDIIVGTETWLTKKMFDSEFFPPELGFTVYRRDRIGQKGDGVIILVRSALSSEEKSEFNSDCENLWVQLNLVGSKSVLIGAYYKPHEFDQHSLDELSKSLDMVKQTSTNIWLMGDFNLPKVDWQSSAPTPDCKFPTFYRECLEVFNDCLLEQTVTSPTRGKHILDLFFNSNPTLIDRVSILPGFSDHDIVRVLVNTIPSQTKQVPRNTPFIKKQIGTSLNKLWGFFSLSSSLTLLPQMSKNCGICLLADWSKALINLSPQGKLALVMAFHG